MRNFTHRLPKSGHFSSKLGHFFPIFEKGQERPPPSSYAPAPGTKRILPTIDFTFTRFQFEMWFMILKVGNMQLLQTIFIHHNCTRYYSLHKKLVFHYVCFSKSDPIRRKLRIWSHLLKKSLMENFIFMQWLKFLGVNMTSYFWNQFITFYKQQI